MIKILITDTDNGKVLADFEALNIIAEAISDKEEQDDGIACKGHTMVFGTATISELKDAVKHLKDVVDTIEAGGYKGFITDIKEPKTKTSRFADFINRRFGRVD